MKEHKLAYTFPHMSEPDFITLKDDIEQNGQIEPIVIFQGKILDGRHRARACRELGIEPHTVPLPDTADPLAWVISKNLHRRHLKTGQRAAIGAEQVQTDHGGNRRSRGNFAPCTVEDAATMVGVSPRTIKKALFVKKHTPELFKGLKNGEITIEEADRLAKLVTTRQAEPWKRQPVPKAVQANVQPAQRVTPDEALNMIHAELEGQEDPDMVDVLRSVLSRVTEAQCQTMPLSDVTLRTFRAVARVASTVVCEGSTIRGVSDSGSMLAIGDLDHVFERLVIPDFPSFVKTVATLKPDAIRWNYRQRSAVVGPVTFQFEQAEAPLLEPEEFETLVDVELPVSGIQHLQKFGERAGVGVFTFRGNELMIKANQWDDEEFTVTTGKEVSQSLAIQYEMDSLRRLPEANCRLLVGENLAAFECENVRFYVAALEDRALNVA